MLQYFREQHGRMPDSPLLQGCKSFVLLAMQLWRIVQQALEESSNNNLGKLLWRVQSELSGGIVLTVDRIETVERETVRVK